MKLRRFAAMLIAFSSLAGCMNAQDHRNAVRDNSDKLTVGKVQRQISVGMPGSSVVQVLGSPNIVTTDEQHREVWVYDKISTDTAYSTSSGGIMSLILGGGNSVGGVAGGSYNTNSGAASQSQKTLTIIIKFDNKGLVRDFSYNSSSF
jgi:outer membrane protein assembly factor BamE (lipoprotein component of BamABCDE complex)